MPTRTGALTNENGRSGRFISFEGGEGTGKSTQIGRLRERLLRLGREVVATREPGGSDRAEAIRRLLLDARAERFGAFAEAALFAAARADHVTRTIAPALARGAFVLCDRFIDSTRAYQGAIGGVPAATLAALDRAAIGTLRPDLTLILDLPAETGLRRAAARRGAMGEKVDRFEAHGLDIHERIRAAFLRIAEGEAERCALIDADAAPGEVERRIWSVVEARLGLREMQGAT